MQEDPREYWDKEAGPSWVRCQPMLDRILEPVTHTILETAQPAAGQRILDVGSGSGTLSLRAADRVGEAGAVIGVDVSSPLVEHARSRVDSDTQVDFRLGDAEEAELPSVDLILSRFGVMFFRDTRRAFANLRSALRPGGRYVFACWREVAENPWMTWPIAAMRDLLPEDLPLGPPADADLPGPFRFAEQRRFESALDSAGFEQVRVTRHDGVLSMTGTQAEILELTQHIGPLSRILEALEPSTSNRALQRVIGRIDELHDGRAMHLGASWWIVEAAAGSV